MFRIAGRRSPDDEIGGVIDEAWVKLQFILTHLFYILPGMGRRYKCSKVTLSHSCNSLELSRSIPFALNSRDLVALPSVVQKIEDGMRATSKDIVQAITADLPFKQSELERLHGERALAGTSSMLRTVQLAREVFSLSVPLNQILF